MSLNLRLSLFKIFDASFKLSLFNLYDFNEFKYLMCCKIKNSYLLP